QRTTRIDDVLDEQNVLALQLGLGIVQKPDVSARLRRVAVTRRNEEVDLERPSDLPDQVAQKDKAALQEPEHEELALGIRRSDFVPELAHPLRDRGLVVHNATYGATQESRISGRCVHT